MTALALNQGQQEVFMARPFDKIDFPVSIVESFLHDRRTPVHAATVLYKESASFSYELEAFFQS